VNGYGKNRDELAGITRRLAVVEEKLDGLLSIGTHAV